MPRLIRRALARKKLLDLCGDSMNDRELVATRSEIEGFNRSRIGMDMISIYPNGGLNYSDLLLGMKVVEEYQDCAN